MAMKRGQFFILGLTILSLSFLSLILLTGGNQATSELKSRELILNFAEKTPKSINLILKENYSSSYLEKELIQLIEYQELTWQQRGIATDYYFLAGIPTNDNINLTIGNFYGRQVQASVSLLNQTETVNLSEREIRRIQLNYNDQENTLTMNFNFSRHFFHLNISNQVFFLEQINYSRGQSRGRIVIRR